MKSFSFVHVPKTGGSSIRAALSHGPPQHIPASELPGFRVAFVRDPAQRLHSAFEFLRDPKWKQRVVPVETTFEQFVLTRGWERWPNPLFEPMTHWIDAPCGFIGRFETLREDFDRLCRVLDIGRSLVLPRQHARDGDPPTFTDDMRRCIEQAFAEDYERFGYGR